MDSADRPPEWDLQEQWAAELGSTFVQVWFYERRRRRFLLEPQVDDDDTFLECCSEAMRRIGANLALWDDGEMWNVLDRRTGDTKRYPSKEAAEMIAIHRG